MSAARTVRLAWQKRSGPRKSPKGMIQSTNTLAQRIDKAPKDRYPPDMWLRCPNKSRIWERSTDTLTARIDSPDLAHSTGSADMATSPSCVEVTPDWEGLRDCIMRRGTPARVHFIELFLFLLIKLWAQYRGLTAFRKGNLEELPVEIELCSKLGN